MRITGNLSGVSFISPPRNMNHETTLKWEDIITESGHFFTERTMRFWNSRVAWNTLTAISQTEFGFITSEQQDYQSPRTYSARVWTLLNGVDSISEFGEFDNLKSAKHYLKNAGFEAKLAELRVRHNA